MTGQHDVRLIEWVKHRAREIFLPVAREMQLGVSSPVNPVPHGCEKMSFNRCLFSITVIMGLFFLVNRSDADSLRSVREKVRGSKSSERTESRRKSSRHDDEDRDDDSHHGGILAGVVGQASGGDSHHAGRPRGGRNRRRHRHSHHHHHQGHDYGRSPWSLGLHFDRQPCWSPPVVATERHYHFYGEPPHQPTVIGKPIYGEPIYGETVYGETNELPPSPAMIDFPKPWNLRLGLEYGSDTDDLSQFGFDFLANKTGGFGVETSLRMHRERAHDFRDHLWIGDVNLVYELFPSERIRPRVGIGVNWLADNYGGEAGLNLTLGVDLTLWERMKVTGELDHGTLGEADFSHSRATVGYALTEQVEWFAGYDHLEIGGFEIDGILTGMRFRF